MSRPPTRPNPLDPGIVEKVCARLIAGESIRSACREKDMPAVSVVYQIMAENEEFRNAIARARELQQEAMIDETVDMADAATPEDYNVVKLRIWARQWRAAKLAPKRYGERLMNEHTGKDGGPIEHRDVGGLSDAELEAIAAGKAT